MILGDINNKQWAPAVHLEVLILVTLQFKFNGKCWFSFLFVLCHFGRRSSFPVEQMTPWGCIPQNKETIPVIVSSSATT